MVFSSPLFLFAFLPLCLALHQLAPRAWRNVLLLAFSLLFYAWGEGAYVLLMLASIGLNQLTGAWIGRASDERRRRRALAVGVATNLVLLGVFKYAGWLVRELHGALAALGVAAPDAWATFEIHLPIGISFFTFQAISYLIDVSRGHARPARSVVDFALYIALFPQLVAGPIVRYVDVARQLARRRPRAMLFVSGVQRFVVGLAKKVLIANVVAVPVDRIFSVPSDELTVGAAWLGAVGYSLQIYFDFSGYSDMAIGIGRMLGFRFLENFRHPYESSSITEFWRRWHISLSSWFRDYLYIPLGGNRRGPFATYRNLCLVFVLCGLWHGAAWTFGVWGAGHGALLVFERAVLGRPPRGALGHVYTLLAVMVLFVVFRAADLGQAFGHLAAMLGLARPAGPPLLAVSLLTPPVALALLAGAIGATRWPARAARAVARTPRGAWSGAAWRTVATLWLAAIFVLSASELAAGSYNPFIYFRF